MAWAGIAAVMMAAGKVMEGISGFTSNRQNAAYADAEAKQAMVTGEANAARQRRLVATKQSALRAQVGAQGTTMEGSPFEVYLANAKQGELEAQDKLYDAKLKQQQAKIQRDIYKKQAWGSLTSGLMGGATSLAGSYSSGTLGGKP